MNTVPQNLIVIRVKEHYREYCNHDEYTWDYSHIQIIWNSRFTWRDIKQHLEEVSFNFDFRYFSYRIHAPDRLRGAVDGLTEVMICKEDADVSCAICQEAFSTENPAKQLKCTHIFHSNCIVPWLRQKTSCPVCRNEPALSFYD